MGAISGTIAAIIGATALAAGAGGYAMSQSGKKPSFVPQKPTSAPAPEDADKKAKDEMRRRRKISDRTGGKTILTSDTMSPLGNSKTLLGE